MTALESSGTGFDPRTLLDLGLPAHVLVRFDDDSKPASKPAWEPARLIGRLHCADGWIALVQYVDRAGGERTVRVPADRVSLPSARRRR
jgi:hypothetical protein